MKVNIRVFDFRTDNGFTEIDLIKHKDVLLKSRNIKSFIFDVQNQYDLEFIKSDETIFLYFSHSFYDVVQSFITNPYSKEILSNLESGKTKKVIFFLEDMDFNSNIDTQNIIIKDLNKFFGEHINKIHLSLTNFNWKFDWKNINVSYGFGCFPFVFKLNYEEAIKYNLTNVDRPKHFFTNNNEPRNARLYFYKFLIDNNLLDKFEYSFFYKHSDKQYITSDLMESNDALPKLDNTFQFPVKTFDNENYIDYYKKLKVINFEKNLNGYIDIVFETALFNRDFFGFSEKAFKAIICKKPFILFSSDCTYKGLHELGFKTFPYLLDEQHLDIGFDEWDFSGKLNWFFEQIKRLSELPLSDIKQLYLEHTDIYEHNYNRLKEIIELEKERFYNLLLGNEVVKNNLSKQKLI